VNTVILRTIAPFLTSLMVIFSIFVLLRGHNEPGGGFIGGLIAASAVSIYGIAWGVASVRRALYFHPISIAGAGLMIALLSGVASLPFGFPFLTGLWGYLDLGDDVELAISSPLFFDIGVWLVVVGAISAIAMALAERERD
jgi:multicomponent Na+:H+ antiporter subunit B